VAIRDMWVRGAPLIGVTAAYGMAIQMRDDASDAALDAAWETLHSTRPTAINLRWALNEMRNMLRPIAPADRAAAAYKRAAEIARSVADKAGRRVIVAGSVGPTGELLVPLGALTYEEAVEAFAEQIEGLKAGGAEVAWIETMSAPDEIRAAAEAAIRVGLPYTYTGSFDTAGRTMMGLLPKDIHGVVDGLPT
ncbi:homocysteine S-methyltransferase family protein, partial [Rhizobiaceae sp. 2RAB30]